MVLQQRMVPVLRENNAFLSVSFLIWVVVTLTWGEFGDVCVCVGGGYRYDLFKFKAG